ncbi:MAG: PD-(D/E)XK nuclease family protein [Planctomycetota bacterium]
MRVRFILGRAGMGKTRYCLNAIREELKRSQTGPPLLFLTPEQATFEMSRALLREGDVPGYCRAHVLSFRRLAYHVFAEVGGPALPAAGDLAKQMILARILEKNEEKLQVFRRSARRPGMAATLASVVTELHRYRCGREQIEEQMLSLEEDDKGDSTLCLKLKDILLICDAYHAWLAKSGRYSDPDDFLDLLADKLPESTFARGAHVWVDGFAGFTPQELHVLERLMAQAEEFEIALCLDPAALRSLPDSPRDLRPTRLFHQTEETYLRVMGICRGAGYDVEQVKLPRTGQSTRFDSRPAFAHLERQIFSISRAPQKGRPEGITLAEAANPRAEVDAVARTILTLCKDHDYRYRDIAVIVRDFAGYHELVSACFADYGIPYFLDRRREVTHHPLIELARSAVRVAAGDWPSEDVIRFLKTDLARVPRRDIDLLENYVLEHGIEGTRWYDDEAWRYRRARNIEEIPEYREGDEAIAEINRIRDEATKFLRAFCERLTGKEHSARERMAGPPGPRAARGDLREVECSARERTEALFGLLKDLKVAEQIEAWREEAEMSDRLDEAAELAQIWNDLLNLLDELVKVLGDETMSVADYADVLDSGLEGMTLGLVPPALDQVLVGSIDRSRHPDLRAALVIGVGEGVLPKVRMQDPIFTDRERYDLAEGGLQLGPTSEEQLYRERFLGYIAFTRPRDFLWISYPAADGAGKRLNPSIFIEEARRLFPDLETAKFGATEPRETLDAVWNESHLAAAAARAFRVGGEGGDDWRAAYNEILAGTKADHPGAARILSSLFYSNAAETLPARTARQIYRDNILVGSASQFETYRACPFQYFARYVLGLEKRELFELSAIDLGSLYHGVLKRVFDWVIQEGIDLAAINPAMVMKQVDEAVEALAPNLKSEILLGDGRSEYVKNDSRRLLKDLLSALRRQASDADFKPAACELSFGGADADLPAIEFGDGVKVKVRGRVDRVDIAASGARKLVRVIDYKSTGGPVPLYLLASGLHLQLPTYLIALREKGQRKFGKGLVPAGAFLQPIRPSGAGDIPMEGANEVPPLGEQPERYKARGFFDERFAGALDRAVEPGRFSRHFSFQVLKDGKGFRKDGDQLPAGLLDAILDLAERHIRDIAGHVLAGDAPITPYRMGTETACAMCDYHGVCRFEAVHNRYRDIPRTPKEELTVRLAEGADALWQEMSQKKSE